MKKQRPWRRIGVRPTRMDMVVSGTPLAQITIYADLMLYLRRDGATWRQYPIDADALAQALARIPTSSGLLPEHTLSTGRVCGAAFYTMFIPPHIATLRVLDDELTIPLPPLVWAGSGREYRIWATNTTIMNDPDLSLYVAPFPNTYADGRICWGTSDPRPVASPGTMRAAFDLFLTGSLFNFHLVENKSVAFPVSVIAHWRHLAESGTEVYPVQDLVASTCPLQWVLDGDVWR